MSLVIEIASIVAPLFIIAGVGVYWGRSGRPFDTNMVGALVINFAVPCLIFSTLTKLEVSPVAFGEIAGIFCIAVAVTAGIGAIALKLMKLDVSAYLP